MHVRRGVLFVGVALVVVAGAGFAGWRAATLGQSAQAARQHLGAARAALGDAVAVTSHDAPVPPIGKTPLTSACPEAAAAPCRAADTSANGASPWPISISAWPSGWGSTT